MWEEGHRFSDDASYLANMLYLYILKVRREKI